MSLTSLLRRGAAVVSAAALATVGVATASAQSSGSSQSSTSSQSTVPIYPSGPPGPGVDMVTFGDSFTANGGAPGNRSVPSPIDWQSNCVTDNQNWASVAANTAGLELADYSCNGTSVQQPLYVESAIANGALGPDTQQVVFMYGGLDPRVIGDTIYRTASNGGAPVVSGYVGALENTAERIRSVAPDARITLTNYPRMTENDHFCIGEVGGYVQGSSAVPGPNLFVPGASGIEANFNGVIADTANRIGANVVDVYSASAGHSPCAEPDQRWTNLFQLENPNSVMENHPTDFGHQEIGRLVGSQI